VNGAAVTSDANGSATAFVSDVYTWDVRNRLVKLTRPGLTIDFTYDPFGNRTSKKVNGTLTKFLLDGDSVVSEVTGATIVNTLQSPMLDQPLSRNGRFFAPNELGSTSKLTDAVGGVVQSYDYSPFGETSQSTGEANPFQYAGRENDNTGVYYNRSRYYVPEWGRFMSEDPLGFAGGLNRYVYAGNDPINWLDYRGTARELPGWGKGLISALSAIGGMIGIFEGGVGGGGLGLLGGPAAPVTVPLGAIAGAAAAGAEGATAGAALGFGIVLLIEDPSGLFQQASDVDPSTPMGRRGGQLRVPPGTNKPATISGRYYTGHALDRMQERGMYPSVVEDIIATGTTKPGNEPGTTVHTTKQGSVVLNANGDVVTVW
jgi:RHS repeat-associated protein